MELHNLSELELCATDHLTPGYQNETRGIWKQPVNAVTVFDLDDTVVLKKMITQSRRRTVL
jgi:hypothetical protein